MKYRYIVVGIVQKGENIAMGRKEEGVGPFLNVWYTPGGGAEDFETAKQLFDKKDYNNNYFFEELKREIKEELNIEIKNINNIIPKYRSVPREGEGKRRGEMTHYYFLEYLCDYAGGKMKPGDDIIEATWINKKELRDINLTPWSKEMYKELGWVK